MALQINIEKLKFNYSNFNPWAIRFQAYLKSKNLHETIQKGRSAASKLSADDKCVQYLILCLVEDAFYKTIAKADSASQMWAILNHQFEELIETTIPPKTCGGPF